jgi:hypothetical protein
LETIDAMSMNALYSNVAVLDRVQHRSLRLARRFTDLTPTANMNAVFVTAIEFADVCREYPIVYVRAGKDDNDQDLIAPMAVLGLVPNENLYLQPGGGWKALYQPAYFRRYPFGMASIGPGQMAICFDQGFEGFSQTEGEPLFDDKGDPTEFMQGVQRFVEEYETEVQRTRAFCADLLKAGLLQDMRFDATLPDGQTLGVDGFLAIDEKKLAELPDTTLVEWHRNGYLGLVHAQQISLGLMRRLVELRLQKPAEAPKH